MWASGFRVWGLGLGASEARLLLYDLLKTPQKMVKVFFPLRALWGLLFLLLGILKQTIVLKGCLYDTPGVKEHPKP